MCWLSRFLTLCLATITVLESSCKYQEPEPIDPSPYLGCYVNGQISLSIRPTSVVIEEQVFPYRIEFRKIGVVLDSTFYARVRRNGVMDISRSQSRHFYRIVRSGNARAILIVDNHSNPHLLVQQDC